MLITFIHDAVSYVLTTVSSVKTVIKGLYVFIIPIKIVVFRLVRVISAFIGSTIMLLLN